MPIQLPIEIDTSGLRPRVAIGLDATSAQRGTPPTAKKVLLVAQKLAAGTAVAGQAVLLTRPTDTEAFAGPGSVADVAAKAAFKANANVRLYLLPLADAAGSTAAYTTLTFAGNTSTGSAVLEVLIDDQIVRVPINAGDTDVAIAAACIAAANAVGTLPFTAGAGGTSKIVKFTAKNKGTACNSICVSATISQAVGITATFAGSITEGATDPDLSAALANIAGSRYHLIVNCVGDAVIGDLIDHVTLESDANHERGEIVVGASTGTLSSAIAGAVAVNFERAILFFLPGAQSWTVRLAAAAAASMALEENASMPYNTLPINGIEAPPLASRMIDAELEAALSNGVSPLVVNASGKVVFCRVVTTRTKNDAGNTDLSLLDIAKIQVFDRVRDVVVLMLQTLFSRVRWADDDPNGQLPADVATPSKIKIELLNVLRLLQRDEGIIQHVEEEAVNLLVERVDDQAQISIPAAPILGLQASLGKIVLVSN